MLVYLYGMIYRSDGVVWRKNLIMGGIFGAAAALSMHAPITLADGFILDLRNLFVGIAAAFFGVLTGLFTLLLALVMRISIGGDGVMFAIPATAIVTIMGLTWRRYFWQESYQSKRSLALLGAMVSCHLLVGSFLPTALRAKFFLEIVPIITVMNIVGAVVLGRMLKREYDLLRQEKALETAATTDPLTQLINRRQLEDLFIKLGKDHLRGRAILFFDIDNFKDVNDTFGHATGDATLTETTRRIQKCLRPTDIFSRLAGDEFVIVLPDVALSEAKIIAERCRIAVSRGKFNIGTDVFDVSISIGARWTQSATSFSNDLSHADIALYKAKAMGRNCVVYDTQTRSKNTQFNLPQKQTA